MKKYLICFLFMGAFAFFTGQGLLAQSTTAKKTMHSVLKGFLGLIPYMSDQMKFKDPDNKEEIHTHLTTIKSAFKNAKHVKTFKLPGFSPSYEMVNDHLKETLDAFELGQPDFARVRLRATGELCISCHTQLKGNRGSFGLTGTVSRSQFSSDFEYAEFLFLIRNYRKAQRYYEKEIGVALEKSKELSKLTGRKGLYSGNKVDDSLEKILTVHTKVNYNPKKALSILGKYKGKKDLDDRTKTRVSQWLSSLEALSKDKSVSSRLTNNKELKSYLKKYVNHLEDGVSNYDGSNDVSLLVSSGLLYRYLRKKPNSSEAPEVLFWISKIDRFLGGSYLFSLSDIYLKRCITEYSSSPWAEKCYEEFKDQVSYGYTGSAGTFIPKDERDELKRLKGFLK